MGLKTRDMWAMLDQCWYNAVHGGAALIQHRLHVLRLLRNAVCDTHYSKHVTFNKSRFNAGPKLMAVGLHYPA